MMMMPERGRLEGFEPQRHPAISSLQVAAARLRAAIHLPCQRMRRSR